MPSPPARRVGCALIATAMKTEFEHLPAAIRRLRKAGGYSQREAVAHVKAQGDRISQTLLSRWERGERNPQVEDLGRLLVAIGYSFLDVQVYLQIFNRYPPDQPLEPLTETELAALPQLDRRMRLFVQEKPGSLRARILYHAIKGQVLMEAIGDESEKLTAYIEERFRTAEEAP